MRRRADQAALRARVEAARARVEAARARSRDRRPKTKPRRRGWLLWVLLALLLASLWRCRCPAPEPEPELPAVVTPGAPGAGEPAPIEPPQPPAPRLDPVPRPGFSTPAPPTRTWLDDFRTQVTARGPRLARCFVGAARPGALEWSAAVDPGSGRLSDVDVEPVLATDPLTGAQRLCVVDALTDPAYRLTPAPEEAMPSRVAMTLEF